MLPVLFGCCFLYLRKISILLAPTHPFLPLLVLSRPSLPYLSPHLALLCPLRCVLPYLAHGIEGMYVFAKVQNAVDIFTAIAEPLDHTRHNLATEKRCPPGVKAL